MTSILCSISQDCILLFLGFETRFSVELILCNQLLVRLYLHCCYKPGPARQETSFLQGASKVSYILGYNGKNIRLKVSYMWFLKRGALLYETLQTDDFYMDSMYLWFLVQTIQTEKVLFINGPYSSFCFKTRFVAVKQQKCK